MYSIIDFIIKGFYQIVKILDVQFFDDFPVTFLQLILASGVIAVIFHFAFGGIKEGNFFSNGVSYYTLDGASRSIANTNRKNQINLHRQKLLNSVSSYKGGINVASDEERAEIESILSQYE